MDLRTRPDELPPLLLTSEVGSFAHNTLRDRVPRILLDTIDANEFPPDVAVSLHQFYDELTTGRIRALEEPAPDVATWNEVSAPWIGRSWLDVPWYWAEAFFYRRLLEHIRYFQSGELRGKDPFARIKAAEWRAEVAPAAVSALLSSLSAGVGERLEQLLHASLWGNRTDLSYRVAAHLGATASPGEERANLVVDHTAAVCERVLGSGGLRVAIMADNAGTELLMDMVLADFLLTHEYARQINLYLKPHPFYVSDAMVKDLADGTDAMIAAGGLAATLGRRLDAHVAAGELVLLQHPFFTSSLFYFQMPDDLYRDLEEVDLAVVKGDANYRRLVGDAHWSYTADFDRIVSYFPAPVVALRTFKSEVAVGLADDQPAELFAADPKWLVNGRRGVIQASLRG